MPAKLLDPVEFLLNEDDHLDFTLTDPDGADLSSATATVEITDSAGTGVLSATAMTGSGTTARRFVYLLTSGSGQTLTASGVYFATYIVTYGSRHLYFQQQITLRDPLAPTANLPTAADVVAFLVAAGMLSDPPTTGETLLDFQNALTGAIETFQDVAGRLKIVRDAADTSRTFSPPGPNSQARRGGSYVGGGRNLQLDEGLLTFTSLTVEGTTYTQGEQFTLMPLEAGNTGEAYEWIEFHTPVWGRRGSIVVTGKWGIATTVPASLKRALVACAVLQMLGQIGAAQSSGLQTLKLGQDSWTWAAKGAYQTEREQWEAFVWQTFARYRLLKV